MRTVELRQHALEAGYDINRRYGCIDRASFLAVNQQRVKLAVYNTPEAKAKRAAEFSEQRERDTEQEARKAAAENGQSTKNTPNIVLRKTDVNTAAELDIASVISVGPQVAAQIVEERNKRRFTDWTDLVHRVIGLRAAQPAFYASICGLNVDGKSLDDASRPNPTMAALIYQKYRKD